MNLTNRNWMLCFAAMAVLVFASGLAAQEPAGPEQPKPAGRGVPAIGDSTPPDDQNANWTPDTMPLTGVQTPTVGNAELHHSYWVPGLQYAGTIQNQPSSSGTSGDWYMNNYIGGNLSLLKESSGSQLALNYSGGGVVTTQSGQKNGWYSALAYGQNFLWRRWQMQILDQFAYLPVSQFGFGGGTGLSLPGIGGSLGPSVPGIGGSVLPNQTIYAAEGPRYSNSFVTQLTYEMNSRASITMVGSYGLLHFTQSGNVDTDAYVGGAGFNYLLTKFDSIGFLYRFAAYHFQGQNQALGDNVFNVAYGRKITRRLALQINGGPEITNYRVPVGNQTQTISGNGGASLTCAFENGQVSANYLRAITAGSGVLIGSKMDQVSLGMGRRLTRLWNGQINFGYAKNRPLANQVGIQGYDFDSIFAGGELSRPIGRNFNFSLAYTAQIQLGNATVCTGSGCSSSLRQNIVTINLQWHTRPLVF